MEEEVKRLRHEVADLRAELAALRGSLFPPTLPVPYVPTSPTVVPQTLPMPPYWYQPATAGGGTVTDYPF